MNFEKNFNSADTKKTPEKREKFLNIIKEINGYELSIGVEKGQGPIRAEIDTIAKKAEIFTTPDGIKAVCDWYKSPGVQQEINGVLSFVKKKLQERLEKKEAGGKKI